MHHLGAGGPPEIYRQYVQRDVGFMSDLTGEHFTAREVMVSSD